MRQLIQLPSEAKVGLVHQNSKLRLVRVRPYCLSTFPCLSLHGFLTASRRPFLSRHRLYRTRADAITTWFRAFLNVESSFLTDTIHRHFSLYAGLKDWSEIR